MSATANPGGGRRGWKSRRLNRHTSGGPGEEPAAQNLAKAFHATVERLGDGSAIRDGERTLTWNELREQARAVAGGLASLGVGRGDTVTMMLSNRLEFFPCDLGISTLGGVPFSIYQTASPEQIAYVCSDAGDEGRDRRGGLPRDLHEGQGGPAGRSST